MILFLIKSFEWVGASTKRCCRAQAVGLHWVCPQGSLSPARQALPCRCFSPPNLTPAISEISQTHASPCCSHTLKFSLPLRTATPFFFSCPGPSGYWHGDNSFFSQQQARKDDRTCVRGQGTGLNWFRGKKWSCVSSPPPLSLFLPLAKRPGSI